MSDPGSVSESTQYGGAASGPENSPPPDLSLEFTLDPEVYSLKDNQEFPRLTVTITSHGARPITLYTWGTVLNPDMALRFMSYLIIDVESKQQVYCPVEHVRRAAPRRQMGSSDERYFWTLMPGEPRVVKDHFGFAACWRRASQLPGFIDKKKTCVYKGQEMSRYLKPGHRYTFSCTAEEARWWWRWGTKEENLESKDSTASSSLDWSEPLHSTVKIKEATIEIRE